MQQKPVPTPEQEANIAALMADLEASISTFDEKMHEIAEVEKPASIKSARDLSAFPQLDPEAVRVIAATPSEEVDASAAQAPSGAGGLLAQLAQAATQCTSALEKAEESDLAIRQRIDGGLRKIFDYLHQISQHLNVLKPKLASPYSLGRDMIYELVQWQEGTVDYRSDSKSERSLLTSVVLRAQSQASKPLRITCPDEKAEIFRAELGMLNIKIEDEQPGALAQQTVFTLSATLPLQLHFSAATQSDAIVMRARNLAGLGLNAFMFQPDAVEQKLLDELGLYLLGQSRRLPAAMKPIPFKPAST